MTKTVNTFFEKVFVVNLARDVAKRLRILNHLKHHGVAFEFWEATDGHQPPHLQAYEAYAATPLGAIANKAYAEREIARGAKFIHSPGAWGYLRTYAALLRHVIELRLASVLILEDDVVLADDFATKFAEFAQRLPADWQVMHLAASQYDWESVDESQARQRGYYEARAIDTCGSFALGLRAAILPGLLAATEQNFTPFDVYPLGQVYDAHPARCVVAYPGLAMPDVAESRIRGKRPQREHAAKMRWPIETFAYPPRRPLVSVFGDAPAFDDPRVTQALDVRRFQGSGAELRPRHGGLRAPAPGLLPAPTPAAAAAPGEALPPFAAEADLCVYLREPAARLTAQELLGLMERALQAGGLDEPALLAQVCAPEANTLVSVIIPTHGRTSTLDVAIRSVLAQTYAPLEVIVVDDNPIPSAEATHAAAVVAGLGDPRVRYVPHGTNRGGAAARNTGLMHSQGSYVAFLDDDDAYEPRKLEASIAQLGGLGSSYGGVYCGFLGGNSPKMDPERFRPGNLQFEILSLNYKAHYLNTDTALYRRRALARINGFDEALARHQDLDLNARFFEWYQIGCVAECLVQINPGKAKGIHLLDGPRLLTTKQQFLGALAHIIAKYDEAEQAAIWEAHRRELVRYFGAEEHFTAEAFGRIDPVLRRLLWPGGQGGGAMAMVSAAGPAAARKRPSRRIPRVAAGLVAVVLAAMALAMVAVGGALVPSLLIGVIGGIIATNVIIVDQVRRIGLKALRNTNAIKASTSSIQNGLAANGGAVTKKAFDGAMIELRTESRKLADAQTTRLLAGQQTLLAQIEALDYLYAAWPGGVAVPKLSGWAVSPDLGRLLHEAVLQHKPQRVLALGSGASDVIVGMALKALGAGTLTSVDHLTQYADLTRASVARSGLAAQVNVVVCPLVEVEVRGERYRFYDLSALPDDQAPIDLLVVDGPPAATNRHARLPAIPLLYDKLAPDAMVIVDDAARPDEKDMVARWNADYSFRETTYLDTDKGTCVLRK